MRRALAGIAFAIILATIPIAVSAHGTVDQQFTGPFDFGLGVNSTGGVAQGFKPT